MDVFDLGGDNLDEAGGFDFVFNAFEMSSNNLFTRTDHGKAEDGTAPKILISDFGCRHWKAVAAAGKEPLDYPALLLETLNGLKVQGNPQDADDHASPS
jgi:hypothetical protein